MTGTDPIELFNHLDPGRNLDRDDVARRDAEILAYILQQPRTASTASLSRRKPWLLGGALAVVVLATAAFAVLRTSSVSDPTAVACMVSSDPQGDVVGLAPSSDPVAACAELWTNGTLGDGAVPPLSGCVNEAGAAAVYPAGAEICSKLGLAELEAGFSDEQSRIVALQDSLADTFFADCYDLDAALVEAQRQLDASGLPGWTVVNPEPFDTSRPCAGSGLDLDMQQVLIIGVRAS
jgi:hypothetical protein